MSYNIKAKMELVESISDNICFNYQFQSFFSNDVTDITKTINDYKNTILPLVDYAILFHKVNIRKIKVYFNNCQIPEGYGRFYHISCIENKRWYNDFIESNKSSQWVLFNSPSDSNNNKHAPQRHTFSYVQKIMSQYGEYLGVVVIDIFHRDLFPQSHQSQYKDSTVFIIDDNNTLLFSNKTIDSDSMNDIIEISQNYKEYLTKGNVLYIISGIDDLGIILGISAPLSLTASSIQFITLFIIVFTIILLITFFYILLDKILKKI